MYQKYGFKNVEEFREHSQKKFSLLEEGILQRTSTRLLIINVSFLLDGVE